jgi:hypothetical protein
MHLEADHLPHMITLPTSLEVPTFPSRLPVGEFRCFSRLKLKCSNLAQAKLAPRRKVTASSHRTNMIPYPHRRRKIPCGGRNVRARTKEVLSVEFRFGVRIVTLTYVYQSIHRVYPSRTKSSHMHSPGIDLLPQDATEFHRGATNEELHLDSSDLEDCEDVWIGELSDYMLETQKRQNQVADWFEASLVVSRSR